MVELLYISLYDQNLYGLKQGKTILNLPISSSFKGAGELVNSNCTPTGLHQVRVKIGQNLPYNAVLKARRWTGELWTPQLAKQYPERDWILTRILWLSGCQIGINRLGSVDTFRRYIYIHGTPDSEPVGIPASHGCIRMRNSDIITLFDQTPLHCKVQISEHPFTN